jgi:hypothetical protein
VETKIHYLKRDVSTAVTMRISLHCIREEKSGRNFPIEIFGDISGNLYLTNNFFYYSKADFITLNSSLPN